MGRSPEEMAEVRAQRGPFSDPRDGRLLRAIRFAFWAVEGVGSWHPANTPPATKVTTRYLMSWTFPREHQLGQLRSRHRTDTIAAARKVAIPVRGSGKGSGKGRGFLWAPIPGALEERTSTGRWKRKQRRLGLEIEE